MHLLSVVHHLLKNDFGLDYFGIISGNVIVRSLAVTNFVFHMLGSKRIPIVKATLLRAEVFG